MDSAKTLLVLIALSVYAGRPAEAATERTAHFAGQAGWTSGQAASAASTYDRYSSPTTTPAGVAAPPSVFDRAQTAVTESGNAMYDGVEAGIQAANQQISSTTNQVMGATSNTSQEFGRQLQQIATDPAGQFQSAANSVSNSTEQAVNSVAMQFQQVNPFTSSNTQSTAPATNSRSQPAVSPPPGWPGSGQFSTATAPATAFNQPAASSTAATASTNGWSSIGSSVAAPPMIVPQIVAAPASSGPLLRTASSGPNFPMATSGSSPPPNPAATGVNDWANSWSNAAAATAPTIDRGGQGSQLVQLQPLDNGFSSVQQPQSNLPPDDRWPQAPPPAATVQNQSANTDSMGNGGYEWQLGGGRNTAGMNLPAGQTPINQPNNQMMPGTTFDSARMQPPFAGTVQQAQTPTSLAAEPPWVPFVLVTVFLIGSLSANFFLGWSYMDARQKYQSLVRKTADTFRRVTTAAA